MRLPLYSPECCEPEQCVCPETICRMLPDIKKDFIQLYKRHSQIMTKRERIHRLAEPKQRLAEPKFKPLCPCRDSGKIEIVRLEEPMHTRTEQLAYPQASKLLVLRKHPSFALFNTQRKITVNRLLHRSLHSLYSRLSNTQPPKPPLKKIQWSKEERLAHGAYDKFLSKPKKVHRPPPVSQKKAPEGGLKRIKKLSKPKSFVDSAAPEWHLTDGIRWYEPSKRLQTMAKPKCYDMFDFEKRDHDLLQQAQRYEATERVQSLALPRRFYHKDVLLDDPFRVNPKALKGKVSQRILQLATPKDHQDHNSHSHPFTVSRKALKAKMTPRLLELSMPKKYTRK